MRRRSDRSGEGSRSAAAVLRAIAGLGCLALAGSMLAPGFARAADAEAAEQLRRLERAIATQQQRIEEQSQLLSRQAAELEHQRRELARQQRELETLRGTLSPANASADSAAELPSVSGGPQPPTPKPPQTDSDPDSEPGDPVEHAAASQTEGGADAASERPRSERALEQLLLEAGAVLLPQGTVQIEPGIEYAHFSNSFVALNGLTLFDAIHIGTIRVDRIDQDIVTNTWNLRYGLLDRLQLEARVPIGYRSETDVLKVGTPTPEDRETDNFGVGDVEAAVLWHILSGRGAIPSVIVNARARFPTGESPFEIGTEPVETDESGVPAFRVERPALGTGFYTLTPGFTTLWRTDPVVFFAGANYDVTFERYQGSEYGTIDPGDTIQGFLGMNISLSERVSLNFSFVDGYTMHTHQNGIKVSGSSFNDGRLLIGSAIGVNEFSSLILSTAIGVTDQSPDFQFIVRLPLTFRVPFLANLFRN